MLKRNSKLNQLHQRSQMIGNRRRLRWAIKEATARFLKFNPQWDEYFFDPQFLLNRGLPIVKAHIAGATASGAIDLALAWAEEWPAMNSSQRKACLQAQTVIAAEVLGFVTEAILLPRPQFQGLVAAGTASWRGVGIPLAYVKAQNPPGRTAIPV